ncbi:restriction endonuclease subunit S [Staphylococcus equorum]|uniref:restriction endonuclease subunit S n=1 Tax=Staphylococcus equorum TaxID=246432 RepID=UPI002DBD48B1|nr:restriction endonuclease subunit S [Staphylococcus equorum]MEB7675027.1 restriction endonuclease subunit S [Staphylococcus equorum]
MTNEVKNVPELRFPNFSEEWKKFVFKDQIISIEKGTDLLGSEDNMGIPLIKMGNIKRGYFSFNKLEKLRESETIQEKYYIKKGDFLFNTRNTMELVGKSATWTNKSDKFAFNSNIARIVLKDIDTYFFNYLYNTSKMINKVKSLAVGTTSVAAIYPRDLNHLNYFLPLIAEQEKIGEFFSKLDQQIELEEQKLEKLEEQKKGYMQQIFSQKLRFKGDNGNYYPEWKEKNLGDISELITKGTTPKNKVNDGSINFIKVENISPINGFITNTTKITEEEHSTYLKRSQLKENDILFSIAGTLGRVSVVKREILPANTNQALAIIRLNAMNLEYIKTYLTGRAIKRFIANNPTVGAQPNMSLTQIRDLIIAIPNLTEQEKIGSFFKKIDNSIKKQSDKIWLLKKRKKGFLQKMFV